MQNDNRDEAQRVAQRIADQLTAAWAARDGAAFARDFADDADFVNIFAMHAKGKDAVANLHQAIFDGIYRNSHNRFSVDAARKISEGVILAHIRADLRVEDGPMQGEVRTLATAVVVGEGDGWRIAAFQNTVHQPPPALKT